MPEVVAAIAPIGVLVGVALGWNLHRVNTRCPRCDRAFTCSGCGRLAEVSSSCREEAKR